MAKATKKSASVSPWDVVTDMENDVAAAADFTTALAMISEALGDQRERVMIERLAWAIVDHLTAIEERRAQLFHMLLPPHAAHRKA